MITKNHSSSPVTANNNSMCVKDIIPQIYKYNVSRETLCTYKFRNPRSAAAARAPAAHALVATAVAHHDGAADVATGSVAHVDEFGQGVGGVGRTRSQVSGVRCQGTPS